MTQNLWDAAKAILTGKLIAIQPYLKKQEKISNKLPNLTLKAIRERKTITKSEVSRRKEIIKFRSEIKEKKMNETIAKINTTKSWFTEKIKKN